MCGKRFPKTDAMTTDGTEEGGGRRALRRRHPDPLTSRLVYRVSCNTGICGRVLYALFFKSRAESCEQVHEEVLFPSTIRVLNGTSDHHFSLQRPFIEVCLSLG